MELINQHPLVSVAVIAYNSAEYILETLESVKAQTYDNIELVVSDDCSSDDTVRICRKWVNDNRSRFVDVHIVESPVNTGQSGNYNRAFDACTGEWIKEIDGDDLLLPNCIDYCISFLQDNPNVFFLFGRQLYFGGQQENYVEYEKIFDAEFFSLSPQEQLYELVNGRNHIPSASSFYNRQYITELKVRNDEKIPLLEDYPKWINLLCAGVVFHFMNKPIVKYRIKSGISTQTMQSVEFYRSNLLFNFYYRYPHWIGENKDYAIKRIVNEYVEVYRQLIGTINELDRLKQTKAYRLGKFLLSPFYLFRKRK